MAPIPTVSSSKNPAEVRDMCEEFKARNRAENKPTTFPPISFPKKNAIKHAKAPKIAGKMTHRWYNEIGIPKLETAL